MKITSLTRRNIFDELRLAKVVWHGRLSETDLLNRIYDLADMPSFDGRFSNMGADIWHHREMNDDWDDEWVYTDSRLDLLNCEDNKFLQFLCEIVHPVVRVSAEAKPLLDGFNNHLRHDGFELYESGRISGQPVFSARSADHPIVLDSEPLISSDFVKAQLKKCDDRLSQKDYDGAISSARSLVEGVLGEIHVCCTGEKLAATGDLLNDYKKVKDLLNLSDDNYTHDALKSIVRSSNGIVQNIDVISNKIGDRHRPVGKAEKHHAKLVVDSAKTISDFLLSSMEYQSSRTAAFRSKLLGIFGGKKWLFGRDEVLADPEIRDLLGRSETFY